MTCRLAPERISEYARKSLMRVYLPISNDYCDPEESRGYNTNGSSHSSLSEKGERQLEATRHSLDRFGIAT